MYIFHKIEELENHFSTVSKGESKGMVPTMGALHSGHISLVKKALNENKHTIVSIFVNPTQFNNAEDLEKYPQTLKEDIALLETASKDIVVFAPSAQEIYNSDITSQSYNFDGLEKVMEGEFRDGHFDGVGTIVEKLFSIAKPDNAYFGEKDYQQLQIIKKLVEIKKIPVNVIGCPIVREESGLAMSSRNERLTPELRAEAAVIYQTLKDAKQKFGTESALEVTEWITALFKKNELLDLEYFTITDADDLKTIKRKSENKKYRAFIAVYANDIRLIDNIALN
ncbi:pantoate--beta-alanine ligase [Cellulophaga sp. 20_2_10]|uniref:pantoate--beta-alanine ligase n=1 Tax=Cellulophaga sp. 20_2_10 TaxID=2942476 RepID=UPI00201A8160|nr:pantoate--beta-alanine ligase [Cellulophaga sp. 20_2_10]MCL5246295.1 pantoate--beta-alanine ligase [Cellulophaga sp. 20_2_10]